MKLLKQVHVGQRHLHENKQASQLAINQAMNLLMCEVGDQILDTLIHDDSLFAPQDKYERLLHESQNVIKDSIQQPTSFAVHCTVARNDQIDFVSDSIVYRVQVEFEQIPTKQVYVAQEKASHELYLQNLVSNQANTISDLMDALDSKKTELSSVRNQLRSLWGAIKYWWINR